MALLLARWANEGIGSATHAAPIANKINPVRVFIIGSTISERAPPAPYPANSTTFHTKPQGYDSKLNNAELEHRGDVLDPESVQCVRAKSGKIVEIWLAATKLLTATKVAREMQAR